MQQKSDTPIHSLAAHHYTDAEIFNQELTGLLSRTWQFAGHSSQLENAGDYFAFEIAGQNLFCVKTREGDIRTYYNVCQHRAHELVSGSGNAKTITCPYHSWTYDLKGQLQSAPNARVVVGFDQSQICLNEVRTELFGGFIFVNLNNDAQAMDTWFTDVREQLSSFVPQLDRLKPIRWIDVEEKCNWKVSIENYSECYHCQLNHKTFSTGIIKPGSYDIQPQNYCLRHTTECQNLDSMSYPVDINANDFAGEYSSWFLWPAFSFQVYPGNVLNTYHWQPLAVDRVRVWRGWYTVDGMASTVIDDLARQDRETTVAEDIRLVEAVQRGMNSRGYRPGPLIIDPLGGLNSEHSIRILQEWMRSGTNEPDKPGNTESD